MGYNDYMYAVDRSDEYLAHYGIKGMKWGVQKAIASGDSAKLHKQYIKASRKLAKLTLNSNRELSRQRFNDAKRRMVSGAVGSAAGSAGIAAVLNATRGVKQFSPGLSAATGAVGGALLNAKGILAGRHISDKGHARAVKKRDEWQKEMRSAFKGTKYKQGSIEDQTNAALVKSLSKHNPNSRTLYIDMRKKKR